jgi:C1A family cysteine protease
MSEGNLINGIVDNTVNTVINNEVNCITSQIASGNASGNPTVKNIISQLITLIDNAVDDIINSLVNKTVITTNIKQTLSLNLNDVNSFVNNGVDSIINEISKAVNIPAITQLLNSIESVINNIADSEIDKLINAINIKFSNLNLFKIKYNIKIGGILQSQREIVLSSISHIVSSIQSEISTVAGQFNSLSNSISNSVESLYSHLVKIILSKLQNRKLRSNSITDSVNSVVTNVINTGVSEIEGKIGVNPSNTANINALVNSLESYILNILDNFVNNIIGNFIQKPQLQLRLSQRSSKQSLSIHTLVSGGDILNVVNAIQKDMQDFKKKVADEIKNKTVEVKNEIKDISHAVQSGAQITIDAVGKLGDEAQKIEGKIESVAHNLWSKFNLLRPKFNLRITRRNNPVHLKLTPTPKVTLPKKFSLRSEMGAVWTQGDLGSCTAFASTKVYQYHCPNFQPSQLFQYQQELIMDGNPYVDNGSTIETAYASLRKNGVCSISTWPYDPSKFTTPPTTRAINEALLNRDLSDGIVPQNLNDIKTCLADPAHKNPISFGVLLFKSFENESVIKTGIVPMPNIKTEELLGGHAIDIVGYDDEKQMFETMNSWGPTVGDNGFFLFPYSYILNSRLTSDFHTMYKTNTVGTVTAHNQNPSVSSVPSAPTETTVHKGMYKLNISQKDSIYSNNIRSSSLSEGLKLSTPQKASSSLKAPTLPKIHHSVVSRSKIIVRK